MENPVVTVTQQCGGPGCSKLSTAVSVATACMAEEWYYVSTQWWAERVKRDRRERGILVSWFAGGASITWEWIGVMTLFLSTSWVHLYIHLCGGRAIHLSEPPQVDKGTNRQIDKSLSSVESARLLTLWCVLYGSGFLIVSEEIRDWFWIIQGSGFHCQPGDGCVVLDPGGAILWYLEKKHQNGHGVK